MRRLLAFLFIVASATAQAGSLNVDRIAAIDQAAKDFLARADAAKKTGTVPREADPAVAPLLDTVFDTRDLTHGALPYTDYDRLADWRVQIIRIGSVYTVASRQFRDLGLFGPEVGRYLDAAVAVSGAMADTLASEIAAHSSDPLPADEQHKIAEARTAILKDMTELIGSGLHQPGVTIGWIRERLAALLVAAPSFARLLKPDELARLRRTTTEAARRVKDKSLRGGFGAVAVALAEPRAPPPTQTAPGGSEIALESEARGYRVTGRINGATDVKFVVDTGATYVALPQDVVDDMVKGGTVTDADMRGRAMFVIANGKRHRSALLMLRQLEVGGQIVTNVMANVVPAHAHALLGMSFLGKFKSWTLDNQRHVLIVAE